MGQEESAFLKSTKSKWEIPIETMMIIGKYFLSNKDYINIMKVSKKYHRLVLMYRINPIDQYELFGYGDSALL